MLRMTLVNKMTGASRNLRVSYVTGSIFDKRYLRAAALTASQLRMLRLTLGNDTSQWLVVYPDVSGCALNDGVLYWREAKRRKMVIKVRCYKQGELIGRMRLGAGQLKSLDAGARMVQAILTAGQTELARRSDKFELADWPPETAIQFVYIFPGNTPALFWRAAGR